MRSKNWNIRSVRRNGISYMKLNEGTTLFDVAKAARAGADATKKMPIAKAGRAAYLSRGALQNVTDPGAEAVACLFEGLVGEKSG